MNDFLEIKDPMLFQTQATVWFELFLLIQKHPEIKGVRADTVRAMRHNINFIDDNFRNNTQVKQQFINILQQDHKVASVLNQINRLGILARYLPVFGRIVGRMQFDLFHIYTVDQHSLFAVRNLCLLRHNKTKVLRANQIFANISKPYLVYIAALFHDIAKGREGHHADLGAIDAQKFCTQHDINTKDTQLVVWLVKDHLVMSETAQKQDLSDPEVIRKFAKRVGSLLRLRAIYLLTIADISATDPKLWNNFKQSLIYELFVKCKQYLTEDIQNQSISSIKNELSELLLADKINSKKINSQIKSFPDDLYVRFSVDKLQNIHRMIAQNTAPLVADLSHSSGSIEFLIYSHDFKGLFYVLVSILEKYNFTVVDANINNTNNNFALNTVHCLIDDNSGNVNSMIQELTQALKQEQFYDIKIEKYTSSREKVFTIKPKFMLLKSNNNNDSLIEVICRDQHGLLPLIAKTLILMDITIIAAKIVTVGARAEYTYRININNKSLTKQQLKQLKNKLLEIL